MAKVIVIFVIIFSVLVATSIGNHAGKEGPQHICQGKEKVAKIQLYLHVRFSGENQTVYEVARASIASNSTNSFGQVMVADDPLTVGPDINSEEVGRVQGTVAFADMATTAAALHFNIVFKSGENKGSTLSIFGRNGVMDEERELSIVGGTGVFWFARGYVIRRTIVFNTSAGTFKYTFFVTCIGE